MGLGLLNTLIYLYREALAATAGARGVGVIELETLAIKAIRKIQFGAGQVQEALHVNYHAHAFILKLLVHWAHLVVKVQLIAQARATAPGHRSAQAIGAI